LLDDSGDEKWFQREISLASEIQTKLLNAKIPKMNGIEVKGTYNSKQ
jgi:hypothetical protein